MRNRNSLTAKQKLVLAINRFRLNYRIQRKGKLFEIVVSENHKAFVKSLKFLFTIIGLFSAFIAFQTVFISFLLGLFIFIISWTLERILFSYPTLYVTPFADFEIEPGKWLGTTWGYSTTEKREFEIPVVGILLSEKEYAQKIYSLLLRWSFGQLRDKDKNICVSAIIDNDDSGYTFFCYPNYNRVPAKYFHEHLEKNMPERTVHSPNFLMQVFWKSCSIPKESYFPTFRKRYTNGVPIMFQLHILDKNGKPIIAEGTQPFFLFSLKIKYRKELNREDLEYDMLRLAPN